MYGDRRPEFDPDQLVRNLQQSWDRIRARLPGGGGFGLIFFGGLFLILTIWAATGVYTVGPSEQAAVRLFGEFRGTEGTGLHWYPPAPVGTVNVESVLETKRMELGFRSEGNLNVPVEAEMITGDLNIVDVNLVVQYRIKDLADFLFNVDDPGDAERTGSREGVPDGRTLKDATESALRQVVGQRSIDDPLRVDKTGVQESTKTLLQDILDDYQAGIEVLSIQLQVVEPPAVVRDAFDDVNRARVDKETRTNQALAYEQGQIPVAEGAARQVIEAATAFSKARVARANGEAAEFLLVLNEYKDSTEVTRRRLYLEAMEEVLPGVTIFVIDSRVGGGVLPFLSLTGEGLTIGPTPTPAPAVGEE